MDDRTFRPMFQVVFSHAELATLFSLFGAAPTVGVDRDPLAGLTPEQTALVLETARHALRARDLVRLDDEQQPLLAADLMCVLSTIAAPQQVISAYRYAAGQDLPLAFFGYAAGDAHVVHTRPADLLHEFTLVPGKTALLERLAAFCAGDQAALLSRSQVVLPAQALASARVLADADQEADVVQVLRLAGIAEPDAKLLAADLLAPSAVVTITLAAQTEGDQAVRRDFVYWQSAQNQAARVFVPHGHEVVIASAGEQTFLSLLNEMV